MTPRAGDVNVAGLRRDGDGRVTGVVGRDERGAAFEVGARITVGADGMGSTVARFTGAPVERAAASATAFIHGYWDGLPFYNYELFYRPGSPPASVYSCCQRHGHPPRGWNRLRPCLGSRQRGGVVTASRERVCVFHALAVASLVTIAVGLFASAPGQGSPRVIATHAFCMTWSYTGLVAAGCGQLAVAVGQDLAAWVVPVVIGAVLSVGGVVIFGRVPSILDRLLTE